MAEMSQDDIDALFGGASEDSDEQPAADASADASGGVDDLFGGEAPDANAGSQASVDDLFEQASSGSDLGELDSFSQQAESSPSTITGVDLGGLGPSSGPEPDLGEMDNVLNMVEEQTEEPDDAEDGNPNVDVNFLMEMPLTVTFEVGRAKMSISDLLSLGQGSVLELHRLVGEDLDVFVNGKLVARGEVVVYKEKFGARITEIISPGDRVKRMAGMDRYR